MAGKGTARRGRGRRGARATALLALLVVGGAADARGQATPDEPAVRGAAEALQAHRLGLTVTDGSLGGPGGALLLEAVAGARFVVVGEEHGFVQTSRLVRALFEIMTAGGAPPHLAVENGPWVSRLLNAAPRRGSAEAMAKLVRAHPAALAFSDDPELRLYAAATEGCTDPCRRIWGLDQAFGATHVLEEVLRLAPPALAPSVEALLAEARRLDRPDGSTRYLYDGRPAEALEALAEQLSGAGAVEAAGRVEELARSARIYQDHRAAGEGSLTGLRSNRVRERDMKERFVRHLEAAGGEADETPRVLVKIGANHAYRGFGPTNVLTLGNFLHELALARGTASLHVAAFPQLSPDALIGTPAEWAVPLMEAGRAEGWSVVDLRPLAAELHAGRVEGLSDRLARMVWGFDLVVLYADPEPSGRTLTGGGGGG